VVPQALPFYLVNGWVAKAAYAYGGWFLNKHWLTASLAWVVGTISNLDIIIYQFRP